MQKIIISISIVALLFIVFLLGKDFFIDGNKAEENFFGYDLEKYKEIDSTLILYKELTPLYHPLTKAQGITFNDAGDILLCGEEQWGFKKSGTANWNLFPSIPNSNCICTINEKVFIAGINKFAIYDYQGNNIEIISLKSDSAFITSIAHSGEYLYLADAANRLVYVIDSTFNIVKELTSFIIPSMCFDLALDASGELWVVNPGKHLIQNFTSDFRILTSWGKPGIGNDAFAGCCNPAQFTITKDGSFITYEKGLNRIKILNRGGFFQSYVAGAKQLELKTNLDVNNIVSDIAVNNNDQIFVVDKFNPGIRVFIKK